jgi:nucleoside-diphosphate-sugar epimerase
MKHSHWWREAFSINEVLVSWMILSMELHQCIGREKIANNQVFNIGTDVQHTTAEGIAAVEALTGKKIQIELIPPRQGNQTNTKAVIDKAKKLLNYNPKTSLEEGIQKQINWFKENVSVVTHETS